MRKEAASKLENILEKLLTSKLKELNTPENFDSVKIDIYPSEYGINCHISYLMKKPFSREDSDFFNYLGFPISFIKSVAGDIFNGGIQSGQSTVAHYNDRTGDWYEMQKERFE